MQDRRNELKLLVALLMVTAVSIASALIASCPNSKHEWRAATYTGTAEKCGDGSVTCNFQVLDWQAACQAEYGTGKYCQTYLEIIDSHGECTGTAQGKECYTNTKYQIDKLQSNGCYSFLFVWYCHSMNHLTGYPKDYGDHYQTRDC